VERASSGGSRDRQLLDGLAAGKGQLPRVRNVGGLAVVDITSGEALFDWDLLRDLSAQLHHLIEEGQTRVLLNLSQVQYMSSDVLGTLATARRRIDRVHGRIGLCGLNATLREMLRICHLDQAFDIYADESEAVAAYAALA
jgi:anti-sigma B factor antagonist